MKKVIIVKKHKVERILNWILFSLLVCVVGTAYWLWIPYIESLLLFFPIILPAFFVAYYCETWKIMLYPNEIIIKSIFRTKKYAYHQIVDAYNAYSNTLHDHVCLTFSDGKKVSFRSKDENANKAMRRIQAYHSIRVLNW